MSSTSSATPTYFQTMTSAPPAPQSSAPTTTNPASATSAPTTTIPLPLPKLKRKPLLRLEIRDLSSKGAHIFLTHTDMSSALQTAVDTVVRLLYSSLPHHCIPDTRSVTLVIRSMGGVAYTTGLDLDSDHKEIHLSTEYIENISSDRVKEEIMGVVVHEMVHCWQHDARGTAPGGLIEGVADWVRLKAGFAPPHWKRRADGDWDRGYDVTAFFLEWLEDSYGVDIVRRVNEGLRQDKYKEKTFWKDCCGKSVADLWEEYGRSLKKGDENSESSEPIPSCPPISNAEPIASAEQGDGCRRTSIDDAA